MTFADFKTKPIRHVALWLIAAFTTFMLGAAVTRLLRSHHEPVILEVRSHEGGMVCTTEEYVDVRVYANGKIEGDVFTGSCSSLWPRLFSNFTTRHATLDAAHLGKLNALLQQPNISTIQGSYPQFVIYTDSGTFQTIRFNYQGNEKTVALVNPDPTHPRNIANYPKALIGILTEIKEMRQRIEPPTN
jgi:hypothetical protein